MAEVSVLRPGLLVSLHTRLEGGVKYTRVDLNVDSSDKSEEDKAAVEKWQTTKITQNPADVERATKVRNKARSLISSVCSPSAFGLLCPLGKADALTIAIKEAYELVDAHNALNTTTRVSLYTLRARIAENEAEAARAIAGELREMLDTMQEGIAEADVDKIRKNADRARKIGQALSDEAAGKVTAAIEEAREVAREIVKKMTKKGEDVGAYVKAVKLKAIEEARFSFLDMEEPKKPLGEQMQLPVAAPRALDIEDEPRIAERGLDYDPTGGEDAENDSNASDPSNDLKMVTASDNVRKLDL